MCVYGSIHTYIHTYIYIYMYAYVWSLPGSRVSIVSHPSRPARLCNAIFSWTKGAVALSCAFCISNSVVGILAKSRIVGSCQALLALGGTWLLHRQGTVLSCLVAVPLQSHTSEQIRSRFWHQIDHTRSCQTILHPTTTRRLVFIGLSTKTPRKQTSSLLPAKTKRVVAQTPWKVRGRCLRLDEIRNRIFNTAQFHAHTWGPL